MFSRKTHELPPQVGSAAGLTATGVYVDLVSGQKAQIARLTKQNQLFGAIAVLAVIGLVLLLPLKQKVPFFYEVDASTGRVGVSSRVVEELKVSDKNIAFFLRLWTLRLVTINAATLKEGLPSAYRWTRGSGQTLVDNWTDTVDKTAERIARTPGLTREVLGVPTVSFNEDRTIAFVDFVMLERANGLETSRKRVLLTIEFGILPPKAGSASDDADNPLGLAITHFTIQDQVTK